MSITIESSNKSIRQTDDINNIVNGTNKTLIIILTVTLPTIAFITILITVIVCYRRRNTIIWLKKIDNSNRLQSIIVNLSPSSLQSPYSEKNLCLTHAQYQQPRTKTIIYNRFSAPSSPIVYTPFKSPPIQGESNAAFDEHSLKNDEQPILKTSSIMEQSITNTTIQTDFPTSLQTPVPDITLTFVKAIAAHRLNDINNRLNENSTNINNSRHSSSSSSSDSNISQTILLFSQRTEF